jgi:hypothetical protein
MTGTELRDLFVSSEFKQGLEEMSSYLASIMQERPIVYLVAKCLWRRGYKFELEKQRNDLFLNDKRIEFKFNYDRCEKTLKKEFAKYGGDLNGLRQARSSSKWGIMPKIYEDAWCEREEQPQVFVWIICSRDLSKIPEHDRNRVCFGPQQFEYNKVRPYVSDGELLTEVDSFLGKLQAIRPFSLLKQDIQTHQDAQTNGAFPSTYHFRICDFA